MLLEDVLLQQHHMGALRALLCGTPKVRYSTEFTPSILVHFCP